MLPFQLNFFLLLVQDQVSFYIFNFIAFDDGRTDIDGAGGVFSRLCCFALFFSCSSVSVMELDGKDYAF